MALCRPLLSFVVSCGIRSVEPELTEGDGLAVKRVEPVRPNGAEADRARLRLVSANPDSPYVRDAGEVRIIGRVLRKITRV